MLFLEIFFRNIHLPLDSPVLIALLRRITQSSDWHSTVRLIESTELRLLFHM